MKKMVKKMNKRFLAIMMLATLVGCLMTGCGAADTVEVPYSSNSMDQEYGFESENLSVEYAEEELADAPAEQADSADKAATAGGSSTTDSQSSSSNKGLAQKIIKRYDYDYETEKFDEAYAYLKEQIEAYDGYVASSELTGDGSSSSYRKLYLTARIPAEKSDAFIGDMGSLGTVVRQSQSAEDVTLQYSDTESRIASLKTEQESLNKLLEQADSLETIIALQDRLTEVRYELESYQSKKKLYDDLISYSTIDIKLEEVNYTVAVDDSTFFSRVVTGLERSVRDVVSGLIGFVEWIIINLPYFLVWGVIIFIIVKVIRKIRKNRKEKKLKKQMEKQQAVSQQMANAQVVSQQMTNAQIVNQVETKQE